MRQVTKAKSLLEDLNDPEYGGHHRPNQYSFRPLHNLQSAFGGDEIYTNIKQTLRYYGSGDPREEDVVKILQKLKDRPDAIVTVYRGVPKGVKEINSGDWVSLSKGYAADYGERVVSKKVLAKDVLGSADSLLEYGYFPFEKK